MKFRNILVGGVFSVFLSLINSASAGTNTASVSVTVYSLPNPLACVGCSDRGWCGTRYPHNCTINTSIPYYNDCTTFGFIIGGIRGNGGDFYANGTYIGKSCGEGGCDTGVRLGHNVITQNTAFMIGGARYSDSNPFIRVYCAQ